MISMRNYVEIFLNAIDQLPKAHVLEIGVGRGEATSLLVRQLKIRQRLTCVDTHPLISKKLAWWIRVDPRVSLVGTSSLKYLDSLPPSVKFDCVLIDGDHNYYTVYNELRLLTPHLKTNSHLFLHDLLWPYGRRDLYYDPQTIPAEFRHDYQKGGVVKGQNELSPDGRNPDLLHAVFEGGPRNGVMAAIEAFLAIGENNSKFTFRLLSEHEPGLGLITCKA